MTLTFVAWFTLLLSAAFEIFAVFSQSWYVLVIDLNTCLDCGRFIVSIGEMMENSTQLLGYRQVMDVSVDTEDPIYIDKSDLPENVYMDSDALYRYVFNDSTKLTLFGNDPDSVYESFQDEFEISETLHISVGLWITSVSTQNETVSVDLDLPTTRRVFRQFRPMEQLQGNMSLYFSHVSFFNCILYVSV